MIIAKLYIPALMPENTVRELCKQFQATDSFLSFAIESGQYVATVIFGTEAEISNFSRSNPNIMISRNLYDRRKQDKSLSVAMRYAISLLDMAYALADMIIGTAMDEALLSMASELRKTANGALRLYPCALFTKKDKEESIRRAEKLVEKGFGKSEIQGVTWTSFLLAEFEKLDAELAKSNKPENKFRRSALTEIRDIIHGIHVYLDPEYDSDTEAIDLGIKAAKIYSMA